MPLLAENTMEQSDSRSFFNAYIPVVALLLAFFLAVPQFVPRFLSPNLQEPLHEKRLLTATIPLRANGRPRPTRRFQEVTELAKLHRFSASLSYLLTRGRSFQAIRYFSMQFDSPVYRTMATASIPKLRLSLVATTTGTE